MTFDQILDQLIKNTTGKSLGLFAPELTLCATIIALLFFRLLGADRLLRPAWLTLVGAIVAATFAVKEYYDLQNGSQLPTGLFTSLIVFDQFTVFFRLLLLLFLALMTMLTSISGIPDREDAPDFYTLLVGATIGMLLMASANNLLILFLGVEMASVPSYVMVGFLKGRKKSSEASLKFVVYGAGAAGVMLYGTSLLAGLLGTVNFPEMIVRFNQVVVSGGMGDPTVRTVLLGALMVLVGLAFKLSIVPFHFWCPDAFEGAPAEVAGFLSVASKAAAFALLVRFCQTMIGGVPTAQLAQLNNAVGIGLAVAAAVTATFGNLAAYSQSNIKRLLAYSTIAHAGYMLMAVAAMMVIRSGPHAPNVDPVAASAQAVEGLLYYLFVYAFMNLGAFGAVALLRNQTFSEQIEDYNGLGRQAPVACACMGVFLFSLLGMPPFGGFFAKWVVFSSLLQAGYVNRLMWLVLVIGGLNTVFSLFFYARVLRAMFFAPRPAGARSASDTPTSKAFLVAMAVPVLLTGIFVTPVIRMSGSAASAALDTSRTPAVVQVSQDR